MSEHAGPLRTLDAAAVRRWAFRARDALATHRHRIDALNVFPVPDGDTGTNLFLTLDTGLDGLVESFLQGATTSISGGARTLARSTLFAARGNSGVIFSQLVRGLADVVAATPDVDARGIDGPLLADILDAATEYAWRGVSRPVEGTILSVARAAAQAARAAVESDDRLIHVTGAVVTGARNALAATTRQLESLARAGVVDAGGAGLLIFFETLHEVVQGGEPTPGGPAPADYSIFDQGAGLAAVVGHGEAAGHGAGAGPGPGPGPGPDGPDFEVMYLVDGCTDDRAEALRSRLGDLGDSVLVVGDEALHTVHVHTDDVGPAIEAGMHAGRVYAIRVASLREPARPREPGQPGQRCGVEESTAAVARVAASGAPAAPGVRGGLAQGRFGALACAMGPGIERLFRQAGAWVVHDEPGNRVTPQRLVDGALATGCEDVVLLPNDPDILPAVDVAVDLAAEVDCRIHVVPTRFTVEGIAALAVYDPMAKDVPEQMAAAARAVRCGTLARASSAAQTAAGPCRVGDILGFVGDEIVLVGTDVDGVGRGLLDLLVDEAAELVTLVEGEAASGLGTRLAGHLRDRDDLEVVVVDGGQPVYALLIGVE